MHGDISLAPIKALTTDFDALFPPRLMIRIADDEQGLSAAERAFRSMGFKSERIVRTDTFSLFSERNRISEMAVYIVHASLLLIFLGGIIDALYGWRGFLILIREHPAIRST